MEYLGYNADRCVRKDKSSDELHKNCAVLDTQHCNWIGKHFSVVRENKIAYFETAKSSELRRIDFMNYQQN
jgi:hypothetical protein